MDNPLVSVIIIFYNSAQFLQEAIQSILDQSYKNWELLLVDDGSTDSGSSLAKEYAAKSPDKIFYLEHPNHENKGMSAARNLGIKFSKGMFVTFLDADDIYLPNKIEAQLQLFNKYPDISCVFGATKYWLSWNSSDKKKDIIQTLQVPSGVYQPGELFKLILTQKAAVPAICSLMLRRDFIDKIGGFEEEFKGMFEDQVIYSKIALEGINYVDNNFYELYRKHENSCFNKSVSAGMVLEHKMKYLRWLSKYITEKGIKDVEVHRAFKKEVWLCKHPLINDLHRRLLKQRRKFFPKQN